MEALFHAFDQIKSSDINNRKTEQKWLRQTFNLLLDRFPAPIENKESRLETAVLKITETRQTVGRDLGLAGA